MVLVVPVLAVLVIVYYFYRRRKVGTYVPGEPVHLMEPVSSSMLLSEVDPTKFAQVHIVSLIIFEEKLRYVDFRDRFIDNVVLSDKDSRFVYRMEAGSRGKSSAWIKATNWHPFDNCKRVTEPQTLSSANKLVSRRLTEPLDILKPVWEVQFIETFTEPGSRPVSAAIITMHHSMGDGFTLCHQIMRRSAPADPSMSMHQCYPFQAPACSYERGPVMRMAAMVLKGIKAAAKLLLMTPDPPSALRRSTPRKVTDVIVSEISVLATSVDDLKRITRKADTALHKHHALKGKVYLNDLIVAAVTVALGDLMKVMHDVTSAIWIGLNRRSVIERPKLRRFDWGNENLGTCYLQLPTGETDLIGVLTKVHSRMADMKSSPEPVVANRLLKLLGSIPLWIIWPLRYILMDKMSASISNFPGPLHKIKLPVAPDGAENKCMDGVGTMKDAFFLVAPPFSYGPYVTLLSYNGKMYLAMCAAEALMSQEIVSDLVTNKVPEAIRRLELEIDRLLE